jgi:hypothetical protein
MTTKLSETMLAKWQDPEYRSKILRSQKKAVDRRMKRRLLELANGGAD